MIFVAMSKNVTTNKSITLTTTINYTARYNSTVVKKVQIDSCKKAIDLFYMIEGTIKCNLRVSPNAKKMRTQKKKIVIKYTDMKIYNISSLKIIDLPGGNTLHIDNKNGLTIPPMLGKRVGQPQDEKLVSKTNEIISNGDYQNKLLWLNIICMLLLMLTQVVLLCWGSKAQYKSVDTSIEFDHVENKEPIQTTITTIG